MFVTVYFVLTSQFLALIRKLVKEQYSSLRLAQNRQSIPNVVTLIGNLALTRRLVLIKQVAVSELCLIGHQSPPSSTTSTIQPKNNPLETQYFSGASKWAVCPNPDDWVKEEVPLLLLDSKDCD